MMDCACLSLNPSRIKSLRLTVLGLKGKDSVRRLPDVARAASAAGECGALRRTATCLRVDPAETDSFAALGMTRVLE